MKKIIALLTAVICFGLFPASAFMQGQEVTVNLNGTALEFDVNPFIENDRTLVPMRKIFEAVGAKVTWDDETKTVIAVRAKDGQEVIIAIQADSTAAFVNMQEKTLDVPAKIVDDRVFVPLRFVVEALGEHVNWDGDTCTIDITTK